MSGRAYPHLMTPLSLRGILFENRVLAAPVGVALGVDRGRLTPEGVESYESRSRGGFAQVTVDEPLLDLAGDDPRLPVLSEAIGSHGAVAALRLERAEADGQALRRALGLGFRGLWVRDDPRQDSAVRCARLRELAPPGLLLQLEVELWEDDLLHADRLDRLRALEPWVDLLIVRPRVRSCPGLDEGEQGLALVGAVKEQLRLPVAALVDIGTPEQGEQALAAGRCDFLALEHWVSASPDFVRLAALGRGEELLPSLHAICPTPPGYSAANPRTGRELRWTLAPRPGGRRRVMVVGGGPAGLAAASTAAERGHDVILVERCARLGGLLWQGEADPFARPLARLRDGLVARCRRAGVKLQLSTDASRDYVARMAPDAIVCAVGSAPQPLSGPEGAERAHHVLYAYENPHHIGHRVAIIGGGPAGCQAAMYLADRGHPVLLLEQEAQLLPHVRPALRESLLERLRLYHEDWNGQGGRERITPVVHAQVACITADSLLWHPKGEEETRSLLADTVLYAVGRRREDSLSVQLRELAPFFRAVGDCRSPGDVARALYEGTAAALDIL